MQGPHRIGRFGAAGTATLVLVLASNAGRAQVPGSIAGKVLVASGDVPLKYANVVVIGTKRGAITLHDGTYVIENAATNNRMGERDATGDGQGHVRVAVEDLRQLPVDVESKATLLEAGFVPPQGEVQHFRCRGRPVSVYVDGVPARQDAKSRTNAAMDGVSALRFHLEASPNPFNPSTLITFEIAGREQLNLRIYDVQGRLIRALLSGVLDPGEHRVLFDGRQRDGPSVASGIYFIRLDAGGRTATRKILLLK